MQTLLRVLGVVCAIGLVVSLCAAIFLNAVGTRVTRADVFKQACRRAGLYEALPAVVGEVFAMAQKSRHEGEEDLGSEEAIGPGAVGGPDTSADPEATDGDVALADTNADLVRAIGDLRAEDWAMLLKPLVPPRYLQDEIERSLDGAEAFLRGTAEANAGRVSLVEIKRRLTGPDAAEAYTRLLATKPECPPGAIDAGPALPVACRPAPEAMGTVLDTFGRVTQALADEMPDELDLFEWLRGSDGPEGIDAGISKARTIVGRIHELATGSLYAVAIFPALIAMLCVRRVGDLLWWWGVPVLVAGAISLPGAGVCLQMGNAMVDAFRNEEFPEEVPLHAARTIVGVLQALNRQLMLPALVAAILVFAAGLAAVVFAVLAAKRAAALPPPLPAVPTSFR